MHLFKSIMPVRAQCHTRWDESGDVKDGFRILSMVKWHGHVKESMLLSLHLSCKSPPFLLLLSSYILQNLRDLRDWSWARLRTLAPVKKTSIKLSHGVHYFSLYILCGISLLSMYISLSI